MEIKYFPTYTEAWDFMCSCDDKGLFATYPQDFVQDGVKRYWIKCGDKKEMFVAHCEG